MSCSRCGQSSRAPRVVSTPSAINRNVSGSINPPRPVAGVASSGIPNNAIRSAIAGLKYVPTK